MVKGMLYDIENHNDFYDSLHIMESMEDEMFDLIYMELPTYSKKTQYLFYKSVIYEHQLYPDIINNVYSIESSFLLKSIENAYRLLSNNGVLVLYVPKTTKTHINYNLILSQFFPSIKDVFLYRENTLFPGKINTIFFCSKDEYFLFPEKSLYPINCYEYKDCLGFYRLVPTTVSKKQHSYNYTWNNITPPPDFAWIYPKEYLYRLDYEKKLCIKHNEVFEKIYRDDELENLDFESQFFWKTSSSSIDEWNSPYYCDNSAILEKIFSLYCTANDHVFCPFDYCNMFPYIADNEHLIWTSIKIHAYDDFRKNIYPMEHCQYKLVNTLPPLDNNVEYRKNLLCDSTDVLEMTYELETLAKSIKTVKNVLRIDDTKEPYPFGYMDISEDALAEKFHSFISSNITAEMLDSVSAIAQKQHATYWNKLESKCQKYIKTALVLSHKINSTDIDGAPVLLELFKTLESEIYIKLFLSYAQYLKKQTVSMKKKYKNMSHHRETKEFWNYLNCYITENNEIPLTVGRMNDILERTLNRNPRHTIYIDFRKYLHSILKPAFFENNFTINISKLTNIRNEGIHEDLTSPQKLKECTKIINEKLSHLLCNLYDISDKNITQSLSNKTDKVH